MAAMVMSTCLWPTPSACSPGEFGFLPRAVPKVGEPPNSVELAKNDSEAKTEDNAYMFRTIRLYDHTATNPQDKIYDNFVAQNDDGTVSGARVNPLSDLQQVLSAAVFLHPR